MKSGNFCEGHHCQSNMYATVDVKFKEWPGIHLNCFVFLGFDACKVRNSGTSAFKYLIKTVLLCFIKTTLI